MKNAYKRENGKGEAYYVYRTEEESIPIDREIYGCIALEERKERYQKEKDIKIGLCSYDDPEVRTRIALKGGGKDAVFKTVLARCILKMMLPMERAVVCRRTCRRMSAAQTAADLGISESTVRRIYARAVKKAREAFSEGS